MQQHAACSIVSGSTFFGGSSMQHRQRQHLAPSSAAASSAAASSANGGRIGWIVGLVDTTSRHRRRHRRPGGYNESDIVKTQIIVTRNQWSRSQSAHAINRHTQSKWRSALYSYLGVGANHDRCHRRVENEVTQHNHNDDTQRTTQAASPIQSRVA
jgi:hypothetical protein